MTITMMFHQFERLLLVFLHHLFMTHHCQWRTKKAISKVKIWYKTFFLVTENNKKELQLQLEKEPQSLLQK